MLRLGIIQKHSRGTHKMSALDYFNTYVRDKTASSFNKIEYEYDSWCNACSYKCPICQLTEKASDAMTQHLFSEHGLARENAESIYGSLISSQIIHFCLICQSPVLHDIASLNEHMSKHALTLLSYYVTHIAKSNVEQKGDVAKKSVVTVTTSSTTAASNNTLWMDKCVFQCKICKTQLSSMSTFKRHVADQHALTVTEYTEHHGSGIIVANYHLCLLCKGPITCDEEFIKDHLVIKILES